MELTPTGPTLGSTVEYWSSIVRPYFPVVSVSLLRRRNGSTLSDTKDPRLVVVVSEESPEEQFFLFEDK